MPAKALFLTIEMCWLYRPLRGQARSYAFGRSGSGGGPQRANLDAGLFSRADVDLASATKPVGARLPAKALFLTKEMCRRYRPLRGQARSYAFGRSGSGGGPQRANLDAGLFSRADIGFGVWHKTCRSALAREGFGSDDRDVSAAPASSRASALLRLRQKRVRQGLGCGSQRANLDAGLFSRADIGFGVCREPVGTRLPAKALFLTKEMCRLHWPLRGQARSYAFGRSGSGKASAASLNEQISMRGYSHGQT